MQAPLWTDRTLNVEVNSRTTIASHIPYYFIINIANQETLEAFDIEVMYRQLPHWVDHFLARNKLPEWVVPWILQDVEYSIIDGAFIVFVSHKKMVDVIQQCMRYVYERFMLGPVLISEVIDLFDES